METHQTFCRSKSEISLASEYPGIDMAEDEIATAMEVERRRKKPVAEKVGSMTPALSVITSQGESSNSQWKDMGSPVAEENNHKRDEERVERPDSRQSRQSSSSDISPSRILSIPTAEARARWAMLASLAGVSHNEHSHHTQDEIATRRQGQSQSDVEFAGEGTAPENTSATSFLQMPNPDDFVRSLVSTNNIGMEIERAEMMKGHSKRNSSNMIGDIAASIEHAFLSETIHSASPSARVDALDHKPTHRFEEMGSEIPTAESVSTEKIESEVRKAQDVVVKAKAFLKNRLQSDFMARSKGPRETSKAAKESVINSLSSLSENIDRKFHDSLDTIHDETRKSSEHLLPSRETLLKTEIDGLYNHAMSFNSGVEVEKLGERTQEVLGKIVSHQEYGSMERTTTGEQSLPFPGPDHKGSYSDTSTQHLTSMFDGLESLKTNLNVAPTARAFEPAPQSSLSVKAQNAATNITGQQKPLPAKKSMPLRTGNPDTKAVDTEKAVQNTASHIGTQRRQHRGSQQISSHPSTGFWTSDRVKEPSPNRTQKIPDRRRPGIDLAKQDEMKAVPSYSGSHTELPISGREQQSTIKQAPPSTLPIHRRSELNRIPPKAGKLTQTQPRTSLMQPAAARDRRQTIRSEKPKTVGLVVAIEKAVSTTPSSAKDMPVRYPQPLATPQNYPQKKVLQPYQTQEGSSTVEQRPSTVFGEVDPARLGPQPRRRDDPGVESMTMQYIKSQRQYGNSNLTTPNHLPSKPSSTTSASIHISSTSRKAARTPPTKAFDRDESGFSNHKTRNQAQETESSTSFRNDLTLGAYDEADPDTADLTPEMPYTFGDSPEKQQASPPQHFVEQPPDCEEESCPPELQLPSVEAIVNGIESYLDTFEQQQRMTVETFKHGQAGFLDMVIQLVIDMARDAMPEVRRRLEGNEFVENPNGGEIAENSV